MSVDVKEDIVLPRRRRLVYWLVFIVTLLFETVAGLEIGARIFIALDLLPKLPSLIRRVCSGYAPMWGVLRTRSV